MLILTFIQQIYQLAKLAQKYHKPQRFAFFYLIKDVYGTAILPCCNAKQSTAQGTASRPKSACKRHAKATSTGTKQYAGESREAAQRGMTDTQKNKGYEASKAP